MLSALPGVRAEEIARQVATRLGFELITQSRVESLYQAEFQSDATRGYADLVTATLARLATERHLVFCGPGGQ